MCQDGLTYTGCVSSFYRGLKSMQPDGNFRGHYAPGVGMKEVSSLVKTDEY